MLLIVTFGSRATRWRIEDGRWRMKVRGQRTEDRERRREGGQLAEVRRTEEHSTFNIEGNKGRPENLTAEIARPS